MIVSAVEKKAIAFPSIETAHDTDSTDARMKIGIDKYPSICITASVPCCMDDFFVYLPSRSVSFCTNESQGLINIRVSAFTHPCLAVLCQNGRNVHLKSWRGRDEGKVSSIP
jgi:hypothetical protein